MKTELVELTEDTQIKVTEDTQYVLSFPSFEKDRSYKINLVFEKSGVEAELLGLFKLHEGDYLDLTTVSTHKVPHTTCDVQIKGVLLDNCESAYMGKIVIDEKAQQTSSFLHDAVLVLGDSTKNRSDPVLEIDANDVQASHGATTGRIDEKQIYYLQSRGLSLEEAKNTIVEGFYESLLSTIKDDKIAADVRNSLK